MDVTIHIDELVIEGSRADVTAAELVAALSPRVAGVVNAQTLPAVGRAIQSKLSAPAIADRSAEPRSPAIH